MSSALRSSRPPPPELRAAALRRADNARAVTGLVVATLVTGIGAAVIQLGERRLAMHWPLTAVLLCTSVYCGLLWWRYRGGRQVEQSRVIVAGVVLTLCALVAQAEIGVLSGGAVVLVLLVYAYGLGDWRPKGWIVYSTSAIGFLLLSIGVIAGWVPSEGALIGPTADGPRAHYLLPLFVEIVLGLTFWMARRTRRFMLAAIDQVERAHVEIAQREAQLAEVRADLARAVGAARVGRYTGETLDGYCLAEVIGRGAMGEVYRAIDVLDERPVAVKVLHANMLGDTAAIERFVREAGVSSALESPHIVTVLGSGRAPDGCPFLAMELLDGSDLAEILRQRGRLSLRDVVDMVAEVARALEVAHDAGIVHRDVKPQNVFLCHGGGVRRWKVLDFGVSKVSGAHTLTKDTVLGTPSYMAPEQARGLRVDRRADVFALAAIAYRCLTGRPAFSGADVYSLMYEVIHVQPVAPRELCALPREVELALALGLAKGRDRRCATALEFARALRSAAGNELAAPLRASARALLSEQPWGREIARPHESLGEAAAERPFPSVPPPEPLPATRRTSPPAEPLDDSVPDPVRSASGVRALPGAEPPDAADAEPPAPSSRRR